MCDQNKDLLGLHAWRFLSMQKGAFHFGISRIWVMNANQMIAYLNFFKVCACIALKARSGLWWGGSVCSCLEDLNYYL